MAISAIKERQYPLHLVTRIGKDDASTTAQDLGQIPANSLVQGTAVVEEAFTSATMTIKLDGTAIITVAPADAAGTVKTVMAQVPSGSGALTVEFDTASDTTGNVFVDLNYVQIGRVNEVQDA